MPNALFVPTQWINLRALQTRARDRSKRRRRHERGGRKLARPRGEPAAVDGRRAGRTAATAAENLRGVQGGRRARDDGERRERQRERRAAPARRSGRRRRSHPWLDYPPDFERRVGAALGGLARAPALLLSPLPPAVRFSLARNFGFVTKTFTQFFDKDGVQSVQESIGLGSK